jgi:hypothetical protein
MVAAKLILLSGTFFSLLACASIEQSRVQHQEPSSSNPGALPEGVREWVDYVCSIPDPEAREQAIRDSEEQHGWTFTCRAEPESAR